MSEHGPRHRPSSPDQRRIVAWVGLGSNVGRRPEQLRHGLERLQARGVEVVEVSSLYLTEPVPVGTHGAGGPSSSRRTGTGPWYVNCVARVRTEIDPARLLDLLLDVETEAGRRRGPEGSGGKVAGSSAAPRTLDLDLLLYGDSVVNRPGLRVPHPRMHERRFVLEPLCELEPDLRHPEAGHRVADLLDKLPGDAGVWLLAPPPSLG